MAVAVVVRARGVAVAMAVAVSVTVVVVVVVSRTSRADGLVASPQKGGPPPAALLISRLTCWQAATKKNELVGPQPS